MAGRTSAVVTNPIHKATLKGEGFDNWISIEDGVNGMDELERSVAFLRRKIAAHWPAGRPAPQE